MKYAQQHLPEFDQEMATTRRVLERLQAGSWNFKPHEKSNTIGWNASHIADSVSWVEAMLIGPDFDIHPPGGQPHDVPALTSPAAALELFDLNARSARLAIERVRDETLSENWSLLYQGSPIFTMPRAAAMRTWFFSHMIHHRAILTVYMRLNNIPVPGIYGPSADEQM